MSNGAMGRRIRQLREQRCWSQEELAERSGLSVRTIQRMEQDGRCRGASLIALAEAFEIEPGALNGYSSRARRLSPRQSAFLGALLMAPGVLFVLINLLKYSVGWTDVPNPYDGLLAIPWFDAISPALFLGGCLAGVALNLYSCIDLEGSFDRTAFRLQGLAIHWHRANLAVIALGGLALGVMGLYLVVENLGHWIAEG